MRDDSTCSRNILCAFEVSRDLPDARIEICTNCGKKVIYKKIEGEIDDKKYLRDHKRDTIQPFGRNSRLYGEIYGFKKVAEAIKGFGKRKTKEQLRKEWEEIGREAKLDVKRITLGTETRGTDWN